MKSVLKIVLTLLIVNFSVIIANAQIAINEDGSTPDASAILDIASSDKGILIPRMDSTSRQAINNPTNGLLVFDTDFNSFGYYTNSTWLNLNAAMANVDNDTKIQVEENLDEDIIRFDLGGTEFMRLDSGRIEILNTNNSIFIGEGAGENSDYSIASNNVFLGYQSGYNNVYGYSNIFLGIYSGISNTSGLNNIFTGSNSGQANTTGNYNIFTGPQAGYSNTTGNNNISIGLQAGYSNLSGEKNIFLGFRAGYNETGSNKLYIANSNTSSPLIYGEFDNSLLQINGTLNISGNYAFPTTDGNANQFLTTNGSGTLSWADFSLDNLSDTDNDTKIQVEESNDEDIIRFDLDGTEFMRLDNGHIEILNTGNSVFVGEGAGENDDFTTNRNIAIGYNALQSNTNGGNNIAIGYQAADVSSGHLNIIIGNNTGGNIIGASNTLIGHQVGDDLTSGTENTIIGYNTASAITTGVRNLVLGTYAGQNLTTGTDNVFIGYQAGYSEAGSNKLYIANSNTSSPLIYGEFDNDLLQVNGSLGVGTSPTNGKLEIDGYINNVINNYTYVSNVSSTVAYVNSNTTNKEVSIYASDRIVGKFVISLSDERIKDIQGISDSEKDLAILNQIQITDYEFIDKVREGDTKQKKVIAQQVAEVFPQAVEKQTTQIVPDIYQTATIDENGWISFNEELGIDNEELKVGDKVQIIFEDKKELLEVLETKENTFRILPSTVNRLPSTVFVYGRQIHDFHTVDYQAISMLNVSATQELAKKVEQLERENTALKVHAEKINELEVIVQQLQAQLENQ